jgi:hypothetical protein
MKTLSTFVMPAHGTTCWGGPLLMHGMNESNWDVLDVKIHAWQRMLGREISVVSKKCDWL